ncbi:hypothetical protein MKEN_00150300 [Mycena kentingensis (nom. inval.)]|nr:hypothetical protein MKEN_00150300 [Mycena kentingensis (nom. inval.)]
MASASSLSLKLLSSLQTLPALPTYIANLSPSQRIIAGYATAAIATIYVLLVRALRYRRYNALHAKYAEKARNRTLTPTEAQKVVQLAFAYDMPKLSEYSLAFALFKTYAIPTISGLLLATRQLSSQASVARRYADTEVLISTWVACPITGKLVDAPADAPKDDPRAALAIARVNWLHNKYKISNEDFLYTLGLFMFEPAKWAAKYGWRPHSDLEKYASFIYWSEIGRLMNITDIPSTPEAFQEWILSYETTYMVPAESNRDVASFTMDELMFPVPGSLREFAEGFARAMLDDRTRIAMMQPKAPGYANAAMSALLGVVAFTERHLLLPRWRKSQVVQSELPKLVGGKDGVAPRMHPGKWTSRPWYKPIGRGPVGYLRDRAQVLLNWHDDVPKPEYRSEGYRLHEMGPLKFENEGHDEVMRMAADIQGCPVAPGWTAERAQRAEGLKK